jgi:hypothetical protein
MTELRQRAPAVALREHQEKQHQTDRLLAAFNKLQSDGEREALVSHVEWWAAAQVAYRKTRPEPATEQTKKDAGDERLLCAVLYEGKGEPN